jgi:UDP-GlcNAc:undecaprenyl-phosphate/decaprenyl-phosphate GlcNAc-1-phosphate transferase
MYALLALGVLSLILCLIITPLCREAALKLGFVDVPGEERKRHSRPIPRIGGVAILLSYAGALGLMLRFAPPNARIVIQHKDLLFSLLPAVALVFLTGLVDDLITMKPWHKLSCQVVAAVLAVNAGARITLLDGHPYGEFFSIPVSILWLLACTNAFNLIDGLDGLASGVGLFATLTTLLAALLQGNWGLAMATVPLAGCLLGFLRYNFNPASIFLGDCGSLTIGFVLGCFGVIWSQKSATFLGMFAPAVAFALPLFDVLLSIARRFLRNKPIFQADAGHIHHKLLGFGFHPRTVVIILYATCGIAAVLSLLQSSLVYHVGGLIVVLFCLLAFLGIKSLRYVEFSTVGRVLTGNLLGLVRKEIYLIHFREKLVRAQTHEEFWMKVREAAKDMAFTSVQLTLDGELFQDILEASAGPCGQLSMSFGRRGSVVLGVPMRDSSSPLMASFLGVLHECVQSAAFTRELAPAANSAHAA